MAGKRHLEDVDPLTYKLPRLETEPSCALPMSLCKSSSLPRNGSENHFSYKGTYFTYPVQSPEGNESLAHWSPAAPYLQYPGTGVSQHMRTDGALMNCLLYGRGAESLGVRRRHSGVDKEKDGMVRDLLIVQEKWANHPQHAQGHAFPVPKPMLINKASAQAPPGYATLAVPKPVYRNPLCYVDPRASVSLQPPMESMQKRPLEVEWTVPTPASSGHHIHPKDQHCRTAAPKKAHHPDASFLQLHQPTGLPAKETVAAPVGFPPYHAAFEKYRAHPSTSFLEPNYPALYSSQKRVADISPWSKLQPAAASPLVHSQAAVYRDRSPACYSVSHYPLTSHKQMLLCPEAPRAEGQSGILPTLPTTGGYKASNFPGSGELRSFPSTYLRHHSPRGYYASSLESYLYSPAGPIPGPSPTLNPGVPSREPELRQNSICKMDYLPQNPSLVFPPSDMALYNASLANMDATHDRHISSPVAPSHGTQPLREGPRNKQVGSQHSAFQPIGALDRVSEGSERLAEAVPSSEPGYRLDLGQTETPSLHGKEQSHLERRSSLSMKEPKPRNPGIHEAPAGAPIVITDSPVLHNHHQRKEPSKVKDQIASSEERLKSLKDAGDSPPSSPPMPVINNVFSLAPYRDYIEGSKESAEIPFSKGHQEKEPPFGKRLGSGDCKGVSESLSAKDSRGKPSGKEDTQALEAEMGIGENLHAVQREGSCCNKTCESYMPKIPSYSLPARVETQTGSSSSPVATGTRELSQDDVVLDLSLRKELPKANDRLSPAGRSEVTPKGERGEEDENEGPLRMQGACESSKPQVLPLPRENSTGDRSNFQSSAAFMFKKYKILKSSSAYVAPPVPAPSSLSAMQETPAAAQTSLPPVETQDPPVAIPTNSPLAVMQDPMATRQANNFSAGMQGPRVATQANSSPAATQELRAPLKANSSPEVMQGPPEANSPPEVTQDPLATLQASSPPAAMQGPSVATKANSPLAVMQSLSVATKANSPPAMMQDPPATCQTNSSQAVMQGPPVATELNPPAICQANSCLALTQGPAVATQTFNSLAVMPGPPANTQPNSSLAAVQGPPADTQPLQMTCLYLKLPDISKPLPPSAPEASPALGEANVSLPSNCESPLQQTSSGQYFTALHVSLCSRISYFVSGTSLELLKQWLRRVELDGEQKESSKSALKPKNGSRILEALKPSKGKEIWLGFKDISVLLSKLLSQLETFMFTRKCPFPHVVRAGAIFIPIHVVKEKLFPKLSGASVDHVLQEHKVELRPTTLSEEKLLRDLELKCCTSRMLKLLALKQLPDIYPDLLNLHWHDCVKQQLGEPGAGALAAESKAVAADYLKKRVTGQLMGAIARMPASLSKGKHRKGKFVTSSQQGSPFQEEAAAMEPEQTQPLDETPQGSCSSPPGGDSLLKDGKASSQDVPSSLGSKPNRFFPSSDPKRQLLQRHKPHQPLQLKLASEVSRKTRSTSRVLHLRNSMVQIKFQRVLRGVRRPTLHGTRRIQGRSLTSRQGCSLLSKTFRHKAESLTSPSRYPELVGKRIKHLYEEKDKTEAWYRGVVLRIHKRHKDPLKTVYEVKYDSEPEWQYYLEILQDYKKGWLKVDE